MSQVCWEDGRLACSPHISGTDGAMHIHIFCKLKTVGEPTAEFREEMYSKNVRVAWCMSLAIILVNFTDPFFARNSGNIFVSCGQREAVPGARMLMLHFLKQKRGVME
jgi:hypothetical protein